MLAQQAYEQARIEFVNAARLKPADPLPTFKLGLVDEAEGDTINAFNAFTEAATQDGHFAAAQVKLAQYYLAADQLEVAQDHLASVLADQPDNADAHGLRGALLLRQGDLAGAEAEAALALARDPGNLFALGARIGAAVARGDGAATASLLDAALALHPDNAELRDLAITAYDRLGDEKRLEAAYAAMFKLAPPARAYRASLANRLVASGRLDAAELILRDGVAADPHDLPMRQTLFSFLADHRGLESAEAEIAADRAANPDDRELPFQLAEIYASRGSLAKATATLADLSRHATVEQDRYKADTMLARIALTAGQIETAASLVRNVLDAAPGEHGALYIRALIEAGQGATATAVDDLRSITREDPGDARAQELLAELLLRQGHPDLAIDTLSQVVERNAANPVALVRLAQLYHLIGKSADALVILHAATKTEPDNALAWESTARIALDIKDWGEAGRAIAALKTLPGQQTLARLLDAARLAGTGKPDEALAAMLEVATAERAGPLAQHALEAAVTLERSLNRLGDLGPRLQALNVDPGLKAMIGGRVAYELGQTTAATTLLDTAIASGIGEPDIYTDRATLAVQAGQTDAALTILRKGAALLPADTSIPLMLGTVLLLAGQDRQAIQTYDVLLANNPALDIAANNEAATIADHEYGDHAALERARTLAERFRVSDNLGFLDTLGWVYYREGSLKEALSVFERASRIGELPPVMHYHYGATLLAANRRDDARRELTAAVAAPGFDELPAAQKLLTGL